jgi:hypothetical protein
VLFGLETGGVFDQDHHAFATFGAGALHARTASGAFATFSAMLRPACARMMD